MSENKKNKCSQMIILSLPRPEKQTDIMKLFKKNILQQQYLHTKTQKTKIWIISFCVLKKKSI